MTDVSNSSKPALKSHKVAADAQRAAEARKAAELKAQQAADAGAHSTDINPLDASLILQSRSSSQVLPSRSTTPGTRSSSDDDEPEEEVRPPKGKRKAIGTFAQVHTIQSLISVLLVNLDTPSEPSTDSESIGRQKKKCMYVTFTVSNL